MFTELAANVRLLPYHNKTNTAWQIICVCMRVRETATHDIKEMMITYLGNYALDINTGWAGSTPELTSCCLACSTCSTTQVAEFWYVNISEHQLVQSTVSYLGWELSLWEGTISDLKTMYVCKLLDSWNSECHNPAGTGWTASQQTVQHHSPQKGAT